jgi:hypothetical protein
VEPWYSDTDAPTIEPLAWHAALCPACSWLYTGVWPTRLYERGTVVFRASVCQLRVTLHAKFNGSLPEHRNRISRGVLHHHVSTSIPEVVESIHKKHFPPARGSFRSRTNSMGCCDADRYFMFCRRPDLASQHPATLHHEQRNTSTQLSSGHGI